MTPTQKKVYDFIKKADGKPCPSMREIAEHMKCSIGWVQELIASLIEQGFIKHTPGHARSFIITEKETDADKIG